MASTNDEADIDDTISTTDPLIDPLLLAYHWSLFARESFEFTIPDSEEDYEDTRDGRVEDYPDPNHQDVRAMPSWMVGAIRDAVAEFNAILNFEIREQQDNNVDTQLRYGLTEIASGQRAYAWEPQDDGIGDEQDNWKSGDMFFNKNEFTAIPTAPGGAAVSEIIGTHEYHTILQATARALGLGYRPGALPETYDSMEFTVTTSRGHVGETVDDGYAVKDGHFAQTLMMLDIKALQYIYGADFTTRAGDTLYKWDANGKYAINGVEQWTSATGVIFMTIWDGGGSDTYDFSSFATNTRINLNPGSWTNLSRQLADLGDGFTARGNVFNAMQFGGSADLRSLIENAIGGAGNDSVAGNIANNRLDGRNGADSLYGVIGDDTLIGGAGNDLLSGGVGADTLIAGLGADTLIGGGQFDVAEYSAAGGERITISGLGANPAEGRWTVIGSAEAGNDDLYGIEAFRFGDGADRISTTGPTANLAFNLDGRGGNDIIVGGDGADTLIGGAGSDDLRPGEGAYKVYGGRPGSTAGTWIESLAEDDVLVLGRQYDPDGNKVDFYAGPGPVGQFYEGESTARGVARLIYYGGAGADDVDGGFGGDLIYGRDGSDFLFGGLGSDTLDGGAGVDRLLGGAGGDLIMTGGGRDTSVNGEAGDDTLRGAADEEWLDGGDDNDLLYGYAGNDQLNGRAGNDSIFGGLGDDVVYSGVGADRVDGGEGGQDRLVFDRSTLSGGFSFFLNGAVGSDGTRSTNFETVDFYGSSGDDTVRGWSNGDALDGRDGADLLEGLGGNDVLNGRAGADTLKGGAGVDRIEGGAGDDRIETGGGGDRAVYGDTGNDTMLGSADYDELYGGDDDDAIAGYDGSDFLNGQAGDDKILGGLGDDTIYSGLGADTVDGGDGIDLLMVDRSVETVGRSFFLNGAAGSDGARTANIEAVSYYAGTGDDTVTGGAGGDSLSDLRGGNDVLEGLGGDDTLGGGTGDDTLRGGAGNDRLDGGAGDDRIETGGGNDFGLIAVNGDSGDDTMFGSADRETMSGGLDDDYLIGYAGADWLNGNSGADTLRGGAGDEELSGGADADIFVFERNGGADRISDYDTDAAGGQDKLNVAYLGYAGYSQMLASGVTIVQDGSSTLINFGAANTVVTLFGISRATIDATDFVF